MSGSIITVSDGSIRPLFEEANLSAHNVEKNMDLVFAIWRDSDRLAAHSTIIHLIFYVQYFLKIQDNQLYEFL